MRHSKRPCARRVSGQGMTEYIIIVALIALAAVFAVGFFGDAVQAQFVSLGAELLGGDGDAATGAIEGQLQQEIGKVTEETDLGNYNDND